MTHLLIELSKYIMIFLIVFYTFECFHVFRYSNNTKDHKFDYNLQRVLMFFIHLDAFLVLYLVTEESKMLFYYLMQVVLLVSIILVYNIFYKHTSQLLLNNMCMLLMIGFIVLTRLSFEKSMRQFIFSIIGFALAAFIPLILQKGSFFRNLTWVYVGGGILLLAIVCIIGEKSFGANLSLTIGGISIQPSEFIKIVYVFAIASLLYKKKDFKQIAIVSVIAAVYVLILVASKDLGGALLYFFAYLVMLYIATQKWQLFVCGLGGLSIACVIGYKIFSHVQTRVTAWQDPLAVFDGAGYQISQSLFAIGTGGWFGTGLNQGMPDTIPVVEKDFIFSAIAEEFGGIFAVCIIMVCVSCFIMVFNIAMQMKDKFYKLVAMGLGTLYALQVFLTIGGAIKLIPSTGVTLPLVSYGGSSLLSTMIMFGIIQGLYIINYMRHTQKIIPNKIQTKTTGGSKNGTKVTKGKKVSNQQ